MDINWIYIALFGALLGTLVSFFVVKISDYSRKARLRFLGFEEKEVNFGILYKLRFVIKGYNDPGIACIRIDSKGYSTFANWDEAPNPLKKDNIKDFIPEMVPSTYFQPIFLKKEYKVPVIIKEKEEDNKYFIFDGWWFGKPDGYYLGEELVESNEITLNVLGGNGLNRKIKFRVKDILDDGYCIFNKIPKICIVFKKFRSICHFQ